jgi:hypothetical protein
VTPESLKDAGLISKLSVDVKILGQGELTKKLSVTAHSFSKSAAEKIEAAGGTVTRLREPVERKKKKHKAAAPIAEEPEVEETAAESDAEPETTEEETEE